MRKFFRMIPPVWFILSVSAQFYLHYKYPVLACPSSNSAYGGVILVALGVLLVVRAIRVMIQADTSIRPFEEPEVLVTGGPYGFSRNPIYLGFVVILSGVAAGLGSLSPILIVPIFAVVINRLFIADEEAVLQAKFGQSYSDYKTKVRRWI